MELFIRKDRLLTNFDVMLGKSLMREMRDAGHDRSSRTSCPQQCARTRACKTLTAADGREFAGFDCLLWAIGRSANVAGLDLHKAGRRAR